MNGSNRTAKQVVITGATRGLGRAMALRFAEAGHAVHGCGRDEAALEALAKVETPPASLTRVDLTSEADVAAWAAAVMRDHGPPDLLLNNAGVINENAPLWEVSEAEFDLVIDVNLKGITRCIRHFAPAMVARRSGVIVNFSSGWGRSVSGNVAPYCATKWGVEGLTKALAQELPSGTAAVALNPGVIDTDMLRTCLPDLAPSCPDAEAWSQGIVQFLTDLGPQHNGQSLTAP